MLQSRWVAFILMVLPMVNLAAESEVAATMPVPDAMVASALKMLVGLCVIIALIFVSAWLFKRLGKNIIVPSESLKVISGISMGGKERLVLVKVGEEQLLLGVSPGRIQMLHVLKSPIELNQASSTSDASFADRLKSQLLHVRVNK